MQPLIIPLSSDSHYSEMVIKGTGANSACLATEAEGLILSTTTEVITEPITDYRITLQTKCKNMNLHNN